jgi:transposase
METTSSLTPPPSAPGTEDAHTIGHKSARSPRIEVITRGERRRTWTLEQKREIVAESLGPELTPTEVARKYAISSGQLYTWRGQVLGGHMARLVRSTPSFAQVEMAPALQQLEAPDAIPEQPTTSSGPAAPVRPEGLIEILLPGGVTLRVDADVDGPALRRVLDAVAGR